MTEYMTEIFQLALPEADQAKTIETPMYSPAPTTIFVRQVRQAMLQTGLSRLLCDIYGDRVPQTTTLYSLLERLGVTARTIAALRKTEGHPVANKFLDRISHRLALTAEGQKQFQILKMLYGLSGERPRSAAEIAATLYLPPKDIKHLSILMRCRLEAEAIRTFTEETLLSLIRTFEQSPLYAQIITSTALDVPPPPPAEGPLKLEAIKKLEAIAIELAQNVDREPTVNISGQAGTGKTSLALKVTAQLLQQGKRVLFACHSRFLSQHVESLTKYYPGDLTVSTFHALCHSFAKAADIEIPSYRNNKVFNELFPELLIAAVHARSEFAFDAIVVDEGHALLPNFWRALKFCLKDHQRGAFFYFYDPLVLGLAKQKRAPFAARAVTLEHSMRPNFALAFNNGVEVYESLSREETGHVVSRVISDLVDAQTRPDEIVILTTAKVPKVSGNNFNLPRGVKLAATPGSRENHVIYTSLSSYRALTKKVVILLVGKDTEELADWKLDYLSYSAFSRADERLILIGNLRAVNKVLPNGVTLLNPELFEPHLRIT